MSDSDSKLCMCCRNKRTPNVEKTWKGGSITYFSKIIIRHGNTHDSWKLMFRKISHDTHICIHACKNIYFILLLWLWAHLGEEKEKRREKTFFTSRIIVGGAEALCIYIRSSEEATLQDYYFQLRLFS